MRFVLLAMVLLMVGCATQPHCSEIVEMKPPGLISGSERFWRVSGSADELQKLSDDSHRCLRQQHPPIAFIDNGTGKFLGEMRRLFLRTQKLNGRFIFFDDFNFNRDGRRVSHSCPPTEWASLKESHEIDSLKERRVFTRSESLSNQEIEFASNWLARCVPFREPIVWLDTDGELIGVYRNRRLDRFE